MIKMQPRGDHPHNSFAPSHLINNNHPPPASGNMVTLYHSGGESTVRVYKDPVEDKSKQVVVATLPNGTCISSIGKAGNFVKVQWPSGQGWVGLKNARNKRKMG